MPRIPPVSAPLFLPPPGVVPRCFALVPCAGVGQRAGAGGPKQYAPVGGQPMVARTLQALGRVARLDAVLVVLAPEDDQFQARLPGFSGPGRWLARCGGATRAETVARGLAELQARGAQPHDWVLVHDAARCLLQPEWVGALIDACADDAVGGLLALPLADTLKQEADGRVATTVPRAGKWAAQTPQMFRLGLLQTALRQAGPEVTDEASAVEALGHAPKLVRGHARNLKVTWPEDFALADALLADQTKETPMPTLRIGEGWDTHQLVAGRPRCCWVAWPSPSTRACWAIRTPTRCCTPSPTRCSARPAWATSAGTSPTPTRPMPAPIRTPCWPKR